MSGPGRWSKRDKADSWGWERCRNNSRGNGRLNENHESTNGKASPYFLPRHLQKSNPWENPSQRCDFEREKRLDESRLHRNNFYSNEDDLYSSGRRNHHSPQRPRREEWRRLEMREHERQSGGFNNSLRSYRIEGSDFERYSNHEFGRNGSDHDRRPHRDENYGYGEFGRNRGGKYDSYNPRGGRGGNGENRPVVKMKERGASNACGSGSEHFGKRGRGGRGERGNRGNRGSRPQRTKEYFASDNVSEESVVKVRRCTDFSDNASSIKEHNEFEDIAGCCESSKGSIERHPPKDDTLELLENTTTSSGSNEIGVIEASKEVEKPTSSTNFESKNSDTESDCEKSRVDRKNYEEAPNDDPGSVMLAPKKEPATREGKKMVKLLTNFWEVKVESKIVYRYDVAVFLDTPTKEKAEDCLRGARDDSASVSRRKFCLAALRYALDVYRVLSQGAAVIHDGAGMMFSSEDLSAALKDLHGVMVLNVETLPKDLKCMIHRTDASAIHIELTPCRDAAASFDMADLSAQMNRNWAVLDRSWKQFYEILTSQDAVVSGRFTQFGAGCLYCASDRKDVGHGFERFYGAQKSIKFIEGRRRTPNCVVAALVLDHRLGLFFKSQSLMRSVREIRGLEEVERFDFSGKSNAKGSKQMNPKWNEVNDFVKGVRLNYICGDSSKPFTFVAIGISDIPIKDLKCFLPNKMKTEVSVLAKFSNTNTTINPYWPAVKWRGRDGKIEYFPMELLLVQPNQRVPLEKQLALQSTPQADKPNVRFRDIHRLLEELNLDGGGARNSFLKAFGVSIGSAPKIVEGFRRDAPQIAFYDKENCSVDDNRYSWRQGRYTKFVKSAKVDRIDIIHDASCKGLYQTVVNALQKMFKSRGIQCGKFISVPLDYSRRNELEQQLEHEFKQRSSMESILIIFIDDSKYKSHDYLKLLERKYLVPTQQLTTEIAEVLLRKSQSCENVVLKTNLKLGGFNYEVVPESFAQNVWIAKGKTLIVGYDVAHPGKATRDELMNKIPPKKPSVVGFSFNGAVHPEMFIGDYHYQTPRSEKVEAKVLNTRFKWMLDLFTRNRRVYPESIVITRDGVSDGQYRMAINDELFAIKEACEEFGNKHGRENWKPPVTLIIATKRHNGRFTVENKKGSYGELENPKPATVIDTDVVRNDITEFYAQTHHPVKGTAKPTAYQVIADENNMSMDEIQSLMVALSFHHQISGGPVSLPETVYQADEWAKRGKGVWNEYMMRHDPLLMPDRGEYAFPPIDFERMTKRLAFMGTKLEDRRINA